MDRTIITNLGWQATAKVNAGTDNITYTKIVFSSDDYSSSNDTNVANITSLTNQEISAQAQSYVLNDGTIKVRANANNKDLQNSFSVKTYALYAHLSDNQEFIFAIMVSGTTDYYPAFDGKNINELSDAFQFKFSNTDHISITDSSEVGISKKDLDSMGLAKQSDLKDMQTTINNSISGPDSTISKNIAQAKTDANNYTDSVKDGLQHGIDTTNQRVDNVHDQLGGDIASAKSDLSKQIEDLSDKSVAYKGNLSSDNNLNDIKTNSIYSYNGALPKNFPPKIAELASYGNWGKVETIMDGNFGIQKVYGTSSNDNRNIIAYRMFCNFWYKWSYSASLDDIQDVTNKINDLFKNNQYILEPVDDLNSHFENCYFGPNTKNQPFGYENGSVVYVGSISNGSQLAITTGGTNSKTMAWRTRSSSMWNEWHYVSTTDDTAALSTRIDKAQDQLGADIRDANDRIDNSFSFKGSIKAEQIDSTKQTGIYTGMWGNISGIGQVTAFQLRVFNNDTSDILRQEITVTYNSSGRQNLNFSRNWNNVTGWQDWLTESMVQFFDSEADAHNTRLPAGTLKIVRG